MNIPETDKKRVVIVGGGFAGISLAKNLGKLPLQLVLIDRNNYHTFQPLLYQVSTAGLEPDSIAYPIRKILKRLENFHFRMTEVTGVSPLENTLHTAMGDLKFDYLILATGTKTNYFGNKTLEKNTLSMKSLPEALDIRSLVLQHFEMADDMTDKDKRRAHLNFCIVGGGPTGVELAGAFAELKRHVFPRDYRHLDLEEMEIHLFEGAERLLPPMSEIASRKALEFLERLGVCVHLNTLVNSYDGEELVLSGGEKIRSRNCIWAAGVTGDLIPGFDQGSIVQQGNRIWVNEFNQVLDHDNIFALGDIASMKSQEYPEGHPQVAQPAIQQGKHLAGNFRRIFRGKPMIPFRYRNKGELATVGRNKAVADLQNLTFAGFFAWLIWTFVHLMALVGFRNRVVVFFNWMYNYINYDKAARLIVRPYRTEKLKGMEGPAS